MLQCNKCHETSQKFFPLIIDGKDSILCSECKNILITFLIPTTGMEIAACLKGSAHILRFHDYDSLVLWINGLDDQDQRRWSLKVKETNMPGFTDDLFYGISFDDLAYHLSFNFYLRTRNFSVKCPVNK